MIKAVIYDADGVLVQKVGYFSERSGIPKAVITPFFEGIFQECLVGRADLKEELTKVIPEWGWEGNVEDLVDFWFKGEKEMDEAMFVYADALRRKGIKIFIATNNEKYRTEYLIKELAFANKFDKIYSSGHVGLMKPDGRFFKHILEEQHLKPEETVFWDNDMTNVEGARRVGMHAELYTSFDDFKKKMDNYLR